MTDYIDYLNSFAHGATFGFSEDWAAKLDQKLGGDYESTLNRLRSDMKTFGEENPWLDIGLDTAGTLVIPGAALRLGTKTLPKATKMLKEKISGSRGIQSSLGALAGIGWAYGMSEAPLKEVHKDPASLFDMALFGGLGITVPYAIPLAKFLWSMKGKLGALAIGTGLRQSESSEEPKDRNRPRLIIE